jgi:Flp pilus assembly protein TadD
MTGFASPTRIFVAAFLAAGICAAPLSAADSALDELYGRLADPDNGEWSRAQSDILRAWSKSGSALMDLLLRRGQEAIEAGDYAAAIDHLTALTDHAPDFAEGWNARATAFFLAGQFGPSVADIGRALALNPHHFQALAGLGMIFQQTGRNAEAIAAYRASLAIHPHQERIRSALDELERESSGTEL